MPALESHNGYYLWHYIPSLPLAVVFGCIFAIWTSLHAWKMFKTRMWLSIPFVVGGNRAYNLSVSPLFAACRRARTQPRERPCKGLIVVFITKSKSSATYAAE